MHSKKRKKIGLALQGGGSHGAFTWGILERLLERDLFEIAGFSGTSAGAMCMSKEMIAGGSVSEALFKGNVKMNTGMGFLPEAIIDSHFIQRGRFGRLAEAVAQFPSLLGIGLAEDTGLIIKYGNACRVIGSGMVILFDPSHLSHNKSAILSPGTPMSLSNLTTHVLAIGDQFNIKERSFEILPLEAELELKKWGY